MNIESRLKTLLSSINPGKGFQSQNQFTPVSLYYIKSLLNPGFAFSNYKTHVPIRFCETEFLAKADVFKLKNGEAVYDVRTGDVMNDSRVSFYRKNIVNIHTSIQVHFYNDRFCFAKADFAINHPEDIDRIKEQICRRYMVYPESHLKRFVISDMENNKIILHLGAEATLVYISGSNYFDEVMKKFLHEEYVHGQILQQVKIQKVLS